MTVTEIRSDEERQEEFAGRIVTSIVDTFELMNIHVGLDLGLYPLLRESALTPAQLAERAGIHPRYAREWLEQQTVAGVLDVAEASDDDEARSYRLPAPHAEALLDPTHPAYVTGAVLFLGAVRALPAVVEAYRTGGGVSFGDFGEAVREGQSAFNRPAFTNDLPGWIAALPDVEAKLRAGARVADVGCGTGWSSINLATAFPAAHVDGIDLDDASIADARKYAADAGVGDRVTFEVRDAADPRLAGKYDLVTVFEAMHDMPRPVEVLQAIKGMLAEGGAVLVMDEKVPDAFPGGAIEDPFLRLLYAVSPVHCLPVGMTGEDPVGTGTVMTQATFAGYANAAGFGSCEVLDIEHPMFRFYRLEA